MLETTSRGRWMLRYSVHAGQPATDMLKVMLMFMFKQTWRLKGVPHIMNAQRCTMKREWGCSSEGQLG